MSTTFTSDKVNQQHKNTLNRTVNKDCHTLIKSRLYNEDSLSCLSICSPRRTWDKGLSSKTYTTFITKIEHFQESENFQGFKSCKISSLTIMKLSFKWGKTTNKKFPCLAI